ncbi:MAG: hypothetical protein WBA54_03230 [Acidaminobacteraceae bacterium]
MLNKENFIELCVNGEVLIDEIDDFVDQWHESDATNELYEYLGMTKFEYELWVENDSNLRLIIFARCNNLSTEKILKDGSFMNFYSGIKTAARASSIEEALKITEWLKRTGKLGND